MNLHKIRAVYFKDIDYPEYLKHCYDAPVLYFEKGTINLKSNRILSIVGTRQMTPYGKQVLESLFKNLQSYRPVIVSGLAYGVDIHAHKLALKYGLQTIAVLAHGLDIMYPETHREYADAMCENGGIISEFFSGIPAEKANFVKRNRIVAGIAKATIVIESAVTGGSLITAGIANSYDRDVFAVPGRISDPFSVGCNQLIKTNKAAALTTANDLGYILNWEKQSRPNKEVQQKLFIDLSFQEQVIYDYLIDGEKQSLDEIALNCKISTFKTASLLLNLELKGVTRPLPGNYFELV